MCATLIRFPSLHTPFNADYSQSWSAISLCGNAKLDRKRYLTSRLHCRFEITVKTKQRNRIDTIHTFRYARANCTVEWFSNVSRGNDDSLLQIEALCNVLQCSEHGAACCLSCLCHTRLSTEWSGMTNHQNNTTLLEHNGWAQELGLEGGKVHKQTNTVAFYCK